MLDLARGDPLDHIDGYLSGKAQAVWPGALVFKRELPEGGETWILRRSGHEDIGLGDRFQAAKMAVAALIKAERK